MRRASAVRMSSESRPRPSSVHAAPPAGARAVGAEHERRLAVQHHLVRQVRHVADEPEVATPPAAARAWSCARGRRGPGSRRGSTAHTTRSASSSPASVVTATARPPRSTTSRTAVPSSTSTLRSRQPLGHRARPARPSRRGPSRHRSSAPRSPAGPSTAARCAGPGRRAVAWVSASCCSRSSLKVFCTALCSVRAGAEQRLRLGVRVVGGPGPLEVRCGAARPTARRTCARSRPTAGRRPVRGRRRPPRAGPTGCPTASPAVVPSSKRCSRIGSTGTSSSSRSRGRPDLRNRSRTTAGRAVEVGPVSQRNPSCSRNPSAPPSLSDCSTRVTWWPSFASRAADAVPPIPPPTTTTRAMTREPSRAPRGRAWRGPCPSTDATRAGSGGADDEQRGAGDQQRHHDPERDPGVADREQRDGEHRDVLAQARADVGDRLGGGVDRQPQPGLDPVGGQRRAAAEHGVERLLERRHVAGEQQRDDRADGRPDRGRDRVPRRVEVGDLVGDELDREEHAGHHEHVGAREHVGDLRQPGDPVGDAEHQHEQVGVHAAGPAAGDDQGE